MIYLPNISLSALQNTTAVEDICFAPLTSPFTGPVTPDKCTVQSIWGWWGNDAEELELDIEDNKYLDRVITCSK
jgi:Niemann-Pick C1 protein